MNRRIILIILGALLVLTIVGVLWFWFLNREPAQEGEGLGSAGNRPAASSTLPSSGNSQSPYGYIPSQGEVEYVDTTTEVNTQVYIPTPEGSSYGSYGGGIGGGSIPPPSEAPGVVWLAGGGTTTTFSPTPINQINGANISGTAYIVNQPDGQGQLGFIDTLLGAGAAGVVACTPGLLGALGFGPEETVDRAKAIAADLQIKLHIADPAEFAVADIGLRNQNAVIATWIKNNTIIAGGQAVKDNFLDCIARNISRVAINQMTVATVNWINSGFDGKPSFVEDYGQFFTDVADQAAGEFIKGSGLAFLCSPFQLQVRIAIAQSYAWQRSGAGGGNQCSLNGIVGNVEQFVNGDFSQGGWRGLLSFTTEPTNNPFGAYMFAQVALSDAQGRAVAEASSNISPGGFLSGRQAYDCQTRTTKDPDGSVETEKYGCKYRTVTPGQLIEDRARQTLDLPIDQNLLADSFDEVISALMNQLVTKTLQNGFYNLSAHGSDSGVDTQAMAAAQQLLTKLQEAVALAQQYGAAQQGSISDIQEAQAQLTNLANCWSVKSNSSQANAAKAQSDALESRIKLYNDNIVRANTAITKVQQLQSQALSATSLGDVQAVSNALAAAQNTGVLIGQAEVTSAQQNRTTLQSEMTALNAQTTAQLNQCNAS